MNDCYAVVDMKSGNVLTWACSQRIAEECAREHQREGYQTRIRHDYTDEIGKCSDWL